MSRHLHEPDLSGTSGGRGLDRMAVSALPYTRCGGRNLPLEVTTCRGRPALALIASKRPSGCRRMNSRRGR